MGLPLVHFQIYWLLIAIHSYREQEYHFGLAMPKEALVSNVTLKTIGKNGHTTESLVTASVQASQLAHKLNITDHDINCNNTADANGHTDSKPDATNDK